MPTLAEQIRDVCAELDLAIACCDEVARQRVELVGAKKRLHDMLGELTPVRPPSAADMRIARELAERFAERGRK